MSVKVKIGMEEISIDMNIPDRNALLSVALGAPVVKERKADRIVIPYPVATNFMSPSHEQWVKHLIYDSVQTKMDVQYSGKYQKEDIVRERTRRTFYFDGTYMSKNANTNNAYVFSIAYSDKHEKMLKRLADKWNIDIKEMVRVDYGNFYHPGLKVQGNRWLAAIIGSLFGNTVYIPSTVEFWGELERTDKFYKHGSDWISRYYKRRVNLINPTKKNKVEMKDDILKHPVCDCGACMECYTSHVITGGSHEMKIDSSNLQRTLHTAIKMGKADEYLPFV